MCNMLHTYGKKPASIPKTVLYTLSKSPEESSVLASKENVDIGCHSAVFAGAHLSGATAVNVQINQQ